MTVNISVKMQELENLIESYTPISGSRASLSQITSIYQKCRAFHREHDPVIKERVEIVERMATLTCRIYRSIAAAFQSCRDLNTESPEIVLSPPGSPSTDALRELVMSLYLGDQSQLENLTRNIPRDDINKIFETFRRLQGYSEEDNSEALFCDVRVDSQEKYLAAIWTLHPPHAIEILCSLGDNVLLEQLLTGSMPDEIDWQVCLAQAAEANHVDVVTFLIGHVQCSPEICANELVDAAENQRPDIVKAIVTKRNDLSEARLSMALDAAASLGDTESIKALLSSDYIFSDAYFYDAVEAAVEENQIGSLYALLGADGTGRSLSIENRGACVVAAAVEGRLAILSFLLRTGPIYVHDRDVALRQLSHENREEMMRSLSLAVTEVSATHRKDISLEDIKQDPQKILMELVQVGLPEKFVLKEYDFVQDEGGPSQLVYSTLFSSLREKGMLCLTSNHMPSVEDSSQKKELFIAIGKFYVLLRSRNAELQDPYRTGFVFSPNLFKILQIQLTSDSAYKGRSFQSIVKILCETAPIYQCCFYLVFADRVMKSNRQEQFPQVCKNYPLLLKLVRDLMNQAEESEDSDPIKYSNEIYESYIKPLLWIVEGIKETNNQDFINDIGRLDPLDFCESIQGKEITSEQVLGKLIVQDIEVQPDDGENVHRKKKAYDQKVEWLKEKIATADDVWLKKFVFYLTCSETLGSETQLLILPSEEGFFNVHTCTAQLQLPCGDMEKEDFLFGLDSQIEDESFHQS